MPLNYFLASIISYLGLLVGIILIKLAPEEQKPGKRYFILLKKILFLLILAFLLLFYRINLKFSVLFLIFITIFITILMSAKKTNLEKISLVYFLLGIIFYLSNKVFNLFVIESVLIFLFGIPTASLIYNIKKKNYYEVLIKNLWFFVPVIALYFLP